ncbi:Hypothetical predicted protein [Mytilus galloprovincialis]|uniref:Uncharacterized protein n=1 Tax=Mytilus galloprovincialis TaxID=29158 RepID=A0A8B6EJE6_MYTGA|nr:Hypothetical predicted protein [Mytilus galloprovincialis]
MVYKCLDVIFDIAVLLYSFILSDWQLTAFTTTAVAVLCTDIVLNVIVVIKNCCSDEEKSNAYRSSETNQAFENREIKEDGSNAIHHYIIHHDYREESVSREEPDLERLPPQSVSLSDTRVNRRPYTETDHQQKMVDIRYENSQYILFDNVEKRSRSVSYEVHASSKGEEDPQDGIPQKFSDSFDHNDEFDQRKTTDNTEIYNKSKNDRPPPYSQVVKNTNNTGHNVSEEINQEKCKEKYESKKNNENKKSDLERDNLYSLESRPNRQADDPDENCKEKYESKRNNENKKSDLQRDNLYSLESRPTNKQADNPDEKFKEKYESKRNNETKKSDLERDNLYSLESRLTNRQADDPDEENQEEHEQKTCIFTRKSNIESSNRYSKDHKGPQTSVDVQEEDFPEENIPASTNEIHKSNIEDNNRYSIEPRRPQNGVDVQEEDIHEEHIPASPNEMETIEDSSDYCEPMEIENSSDDVQETVATSDFNSSSDWVEPEEKTRDAITKSHIEDCEV